MVVNHELAICVNLSDHPEKYSDGTGKEYYDVVKKGDPLPTCRGCGREMVLASEFVS